MDIVLNIFVIIGALIAIVLFIFFSGYIGSEFRKWNEENSFDSNKNGNDLKTFFIGGFIIILLSILYNVIV
ncbi:MAG: hypothetical protein H8E55_41765 [Pelagibacterales bacterium]|nr:hypothetical protein [Pelagibacterales bacterium]